MMIVKVDDVPYTVNIFRDQEGFIAQFSIMGKPHQIRDKGVGAAFLERWVSGEIRRLLEGEELGLYYD